MRKLFLAILLTSSVLAWADDVTVSSPNGSLVVTVSDAGGLLSYTATLDGVKVLEPSALGLKTSLGDLTKDLKVLTFHSIPEQSSPTRSLSLFTSQYTMR